ncbi:Pycsar system effector family protein [Botryobacter ruber]|uniref:Pycsar system effector family protein n=1 Tax=Botryobacter ruber TaxID=2171629 RepID=UPI000E0AF675|nr:Pycsar system effector family protein [Botryobacter ruber]
MEELEPVGQDHHEEEKKKEKKEDKKNKKSGSGTIGMYRAISRNHVAMVAIGDRRASILIGICTVIISVTFSVFLHKLEEPTIYQVPGLILIITCTVTMVLAILSTRPYNAKGFYGMHEVSENSSNLLFFENFYKMTLEDYETAMNKILDNDQEVKHALVRDLHGLGVSVARKYRYLRISYDVLMVGVVLSVIAFLFTVVKTI